MFVLVSVYSDCIRMSIKLLCDPYPEGAYKLNIKGDILFTHTYPASYNLLHQLYNAYRESLVSS